MKQVDQRFRNTFLAVALLCAAGVPAAGQQESHEDHGAEAESRAEREERAIRLGPEQLRDFGIEVRSASGGTLAVHFGLPGEVVVDPDRVAHVVPRVPGVVREVRKGLGDRVREGELLAVLESRELSELKSSYLVARERVELARAAFAREERAPPVAFIAISVSPVEQAVRISTGERGAAAV